MLRSMLQNYPKAKLTTRRAGFGVSWDDGTYLRVSFNTSLTVERKRDLLALFATWLVADPSTLDHSTTYQSGLLLTEGRDSTLSGGRAGDWS